MKIPALFDLTGRAAVVTGGNAAHYSCKPHGVVRDHRRTSCRDIAQRPQNPDIVRLTSRPGNSYASVAKVLELPTLE
jgi:hypothetical protein